MRGHWIISDVARRFLKSVGVQNAHLRKSFLPKRSLRPKFLSRSKREAALDKLNRPLNRRTRFDRDQQMNMVVHNHEFVQAKNSTNSIFVKNP